MALGEFSFGLDDKMVHQIEADFKFYVVLRRPKKIIIIIMSGSNP